MKYPLLNALSTSHWTSSAFESVVMQVILEFRMQGISGVQAKVEGVRCTWADLMHNVNVSIEFPLSRRRSRNYSRLHTENGKELY
jgi:hypothetical protein